MPVADWPVNQIEPNKMIRIVLLLLPFICFFWSGVLSDSYNDSIKIMWQHSSIGQRIMNARQEGFKTRLDSLSQSLGQSVMMWDYRTNSQPADSWAGWRTARFDSAGHKSGWVIGDIYGYCSNNMWPDHLSRFWDDSSSIKAGFLEPDSVYDPEPEPDTLVDVTDFNIVWFLPAYWHWGNLEADSLASYRSQALAWRDSSQQYSEIVFVYIMQVPIKPFGYVEDTYSYSEIEKKNAFSFDTFWRDTLCDTGNYPNFLTWSFFEMLVETDTGSANYAYVKSVYEGTDDHPNTTADTTIQDSLITSWIPTMVNYVDQYLTNYYDSISTFATPVARVRRMYK